MSPEKSQSPRAHAEHDHPLKPVPLPHHGRPVIPEQTAPASPTRGFSTAVILDEVSPRPQGPDRFGAHIPKAIPSPHVQAKRFETAYGLGPTTSAFIDAEDVSNHTRGLLSLALRPGDTVYYEREGTESIEILVLRPRGKNPVFPEHYQRKRQIGDGYFVKQHIQVFEDGVVLHLPIQVVGCCGAHDEVSRPATPGAQLDDLTAEKFKHPSRLTAREKVDGVLADFLRRARARALQLQKFVDRIDEADEEAVKEVEERCDARVEKLGKQKVWHEYQVYVREHSAGDPTPDLEDLFPVRKFSRRQAIDLNKPLPALPTDQDSRHDSVLDHAMT